MMIFLVSLKIHHSVNILEDENNHLKKFLVYYVLDSFKALTNSYLNFVCRILKFVDFMCFQISDINNVKILT